MGTKSIVIIKHNPQPHDHLIAVIAWNDDVVASVITEGGSADEEIEALVEAAKEILGEDGTDEEMFEFLNENSDLITHGEIVTEQDTDQDGLVKLIDEKIKKAIDSLIDFTPEAV